MEKFNRLLGTLFFVAAILGLTCGCATRMYPDGMRQRVFMRQVGVIVAIQNDCAASLSVQSMYGTEMQNIPFGKNAIVPVESRPFSGNNREIWLMARAYDRNLNYLGSVEFRESADLYNGTKDRLWQVNNLNSPPGATCKAP